MERWATLAHRLRLPNAGCLVVEELLVRTAQLLLKSNLKLAADVRALQSATFRTCLIPSTATFVQKAKEAGQKYNELVQAAGKTHEFGPPHVHVCAAIVVEAVGQLTGEAKDLVEQHVKETDSATKLMPNVLYCRVAPA